MGNREALMTAFEKWLNENVPEGGDSAPSAGPPPEMVAFQASELIDDVLLFMRYVMERTNYWRPLSVGRLYRLAVLTLDNIEKRGALEGVIDDEVYRQFRRDLRERAVHFGENMASGINPDALPPSSGDVPPISMPGG